MKPTKRATHADEMARLTFLVSPEIKRELDRVCAQEDLTTSQVLRRLIAGYLERAAVLKSQPCATATDPPASPMSATRSASR